MLVMGRNRHVLETIDGVDMSENGEQQHETNPKKGFGQTRSVSLPTKHSCKLNRIIIIYK